MGPIDVQKAMCVSRSFTKPLFPQAPNKSRFAMLLVGLFTVILVVLKLNTIVDLRWNSHSYYGRGNRRALQWIDKYPDSKS